ncbi:MAG: hypothetical protein JOZ91_12280 [Candidatus Eremiobacteraeota bacterium]|nr:hypothetical protein [Candidatus Eremiobacteraeota bacterium]MBV8460857.1 hypothetical protein [Candidatus Eremiobacteraeota bacterium]
MSASRAAARARWLLCAVFVLAASLAAQAGTPPRALQPRAADAVATPSPSPQASVQPLEQSPTPLGSAPSATQSPGVEVSPSPPAIIAPPSPVPVQLEQASAYLIMGRATSVRVQAPASGILMLSGFDQDVVRAVFNPIDRTIDLTGLRPGTTTITATDEFGLTASLSVTVQAYAGKAYTSTAVTITGDPASSRYVAEAAAAAAALVAYPETGAKVTALAEQVRGNRELTADQAVTVVVPLSITGPGYAPYHQDVTVTVTNLAQPRIPPKNLFVSDFPETLTENGTLFYADVTFAQPARLLYYHYNSGTSVPRRVVVKAQNNELTSSFLELVAGVAGPSPNILAVGHESTKRYLVREAGGEGQIFEVPPRATVNISDQIMAPATLVSGIMQLRVVSGSGVRVAVVVQDASEIPVGPISDTLLSSAVRHARGVYSVPDFFYDIAYSVGNDPATLTIGKLPLPNLVQGEVLGGDYGVKQSATLTLMNPTPNDARVGMWFEPRGGRATGTFLVDGQLIELHPVDVGRPALLRVFPVPANGYRRVSVVTMPEGGSSYPVRVSFGSQPPAGGTWNLSSAIY